MSCSAHRCEARTPGLCTGPTRGRQAGPGPHCCPHTRGPPPRCWASGTRHVALLRWRDVHSAAGTVAPRGAFGCRVSQTRGPRTARRPPLRPRATLTKQPAPKTEQRPLQTGARAPLPSATRAGASVPCALLSPPQTRSREDSARPSVETCLVARESPCRPPWGPCDRHPWTVDETAATPRAGTKAAPTEVRPGPQHAVTGAGHAGGSTCTAARDKDRFAGGGAQTQLLGPFK